MLELYRTPDCAFCDEVEELLHAWVLAHRVVTVAGDAPAPQALAGGTLPALKEGGRVYRGAPAITAFLDELRRELSQRRQFQSDACYLDPDNPDECL